LADWLDSLYSMQIALYILSCFFCGDIDWVHAYDLFTFSIL